jgi:hypothetical protein
MNRYYFDIRDADARFQDQDGVELPDLEAAETEAIRGLIGIAKDSLDRQQMRKIAIEVRDGEGPVFEVSSVWKLHRRR